MRAFLPKFDLHGALLRVACSGAAFVPKALGQDFRDALQREVETGPFERLPSETGPYRVREEADLFRIAEDDLDGYPLVAQVRRELVSLVHAAGRRIEGIEQWFPNDVAVMRYELGSLGVSPHRDGKRNRYLIVTVTSEGSAPLLHCANREGTLIEEWETIPGSLTLLRAPGLGGLNDRPFHAVRGPADGVRYSLTFRMNTELRAAAACVTSGRPDRGT